jgi:hypothetical protein
MTHRQQAIDRTMPIAAKPGRYRPSDTLLAFREATALSSRSSKRADRCRPPVDRSLRLGPESRIEPVPRVPADPPPKSAVVLTNPDEDCSPSAFRAFLDELPEPEPVLDSLHAAEALRELRIDGKA